MDYEKKLEQAHKLYHSENITKEQKYVLESLFPELKESEDDRIRKSIHIYLDWLDGRKDYAPKGEYSIKDMIAWLEKQGKNNIGISEDTKQKEQIISNSTDAVIGLPYENKDGGYTHLVDVLRPLPVGNHKIAIIFKED